MTLSSVRCLRNGGYPVVWILRYPEEEVKCLPVSSVSLQRTERVPVCRSVLRSSPLGETKVERRENREVFVKVLGGTVFAGGPRRLPKDTTSHFPRHTPVSRLPGSFRTSIKYGGLI